MSTRHERWGWGWWVLKLPATAPLPIFEAATSTLYYSNDGRLRVLPIQYGFGAPTFEVRVVHAGGDEAVLCTHSRVLADAYIAGYDLSVELAGNA